MKMNSNVDSWLSNAPEDVTRTTQELLQKVKQMRDEQVIYPPQEDILNALAWTPPQDVRAVILGQDPYHGPGQAMGLSFSVHRDQRLPPSLRNIYKELVADLGCDTPATGDLSNWARQGVLLLNTTLTVREHAANSHSKLGWQTLTDYVVKRCCELPQPVVFLAWGAHGHQDGRADHGGHGGRDDNPQVLPGLDPPLAALGKPGGKGRAGVHGVPTLLPGKRAPGVLRSGAHRLGKGGLEQASSRIRRFPCRINKRREDLAALLVNATGELGVPLDGPKKARLWSPDCLDDSVWRDGHCLKTWCQVPQSLVVIAIDGV